ncbi:MAG: response regulator [Deltaproteobacteria bacterium]|nr:response regulator [Deltaproteobacteria bacterium]
MKNEKQRTVLLIEDDRDVLSAIARYLRYLGYEVLTATDGMEGLKKLKSGGYDLVVTDVVMPYVSGIGLVTAIKEKRPQIPVIVITGYGKEPEQAAMEKKADIVLSKPVEMSVLAEHIASLIAAKA